MTNQKFNLVNLLFKLSKSNKTGYLKCTKDSVYWRVYLQEGRLKYVDCSLELLAQLKYYLLRQSWKTATAALKDLPESYLQTGGDKNQDSMNQSLYEQAILWLIAKKHLDNSQFIQLIEDITQDSLESCLWLTDGAISWQEKELIPSWIRSQIGDSLSLDISDVVQFLQRRLKQWQSCSQEVLSPHQRPYFLNYKDIDKASSIGTLSENVLGELAKLMRRGLSFRKLSLMLNQDELHVAQILSPYIESKIIHLRSPQSPLDRLPNIPKPIQAKEEAKISNSNLAVKKHKVVCIDDSPTILKEIQRFLPDDRFQVTAIDDPIQASSIIFRIEPDLILLDITMPKINGYTLCGLLRSSVIFDKTPIIMVTGNTGLVDKTRAKLAGATDYFTKPFTKEGLMAIVGKYLK